MSAAPFGPAVSRDKVRDYINRAAWERAGLADEVLDLESTSGCGTDCLRVLVAAEALLTAMDGAGDRDGPDKAREAAIQYCHVCYFG